MTEHAARRADASTLARGGALNLVGYLAYGILSFGLVVLATRRLGADGAGAFIEAIGLFNILAKSALLGADLGLLRYVARYRALHRSTELRHLFRIALLPVIVIGSLCGLVVFVEAEPLSRLLSAGAGNDALATYLRVMAPFIPIGAVYLALESASRGFGTMMPSVTIERFGRPAAQPALFLLATSAGLGSTAIALSYIGPTVLAFVPMAAWTALLLRRAERFDRALGQLDEPQPTREATAEFWRFSAPRALGGIFQVFIIWLDTLLVGALASTREAGIYGATTRWLIVGSFAGLAITQAIGPQISFVLAREERERARHLFQVSTGWLMALAFPAYLTVMIFAEVLLRLFGHDFTAGTTTLVILGAANLFAAAAGPVDMVLLMAGRSSLSLVNNAIALAANIGLNLLLVPRWGITGAATAWAVSLVITNLFPLIQVWLSIRLHPFGRGWVAVFGASAVGVALVELAARWLVGDTVPGLIVGVIAAAVIYGGLLVWLRKVISLDEFVAALRRRRRPPTDPSGDPADGPAGDPTDGDDPTEGSEPSPAGGRRGTPLPATSRPVPPQRPVVGSPSRREASSTPDPASSRAR